MSKQTVWTLDKIAGVNVLARGLSLLVLTIKMKSQLNSLVIFSSVILKASCLDGE
jgi:hypothetical protein